MSIDITATFGTNFDSQINIGTINSFLNAVSQELPPDIATCVRFLITSYATYCKPMFMMHSTDTVAQILSKSNAGRVSSDFVFEHIKENTLVGDIYQLLISYDDDDVELPAIQALVYAKYAKALHATKWQRLLYYSAIRVFDYVNISKDAIEYVHGDDVVNVGISNVVTIDQEVYVVPSEIVYEGRSHVSPAHDFSFEYVDDHIDKLSGEDSFSTYKLCVAVDEQSASIRSTFPDERYNVRDNRGVLHRDDYQMNYLARSLYNVCLTMKARYVIVEDYDSAVFAFMQAAFVSYNRSRDLPVDDSPVLYCAETYDISKIEQCDLYVVGLFAPRGSKRYSAGRQDDNILTSLPHNSAWAAKMFDKYENPVLMLFEAFPLGIACHKGVLVAPVQYGKPLRWCPASPHRTRGFVLCGYETDSFVSIGRYDVSLRHYFIDVFVFSTYRNKLIFPQDPRISKTWSSIMRVRLQWGCVMPCPSYDLFYDGSFLFFDKDKYVVYTGNSLGYDDFDLMSSLVKLRPKLDERGWMKESAFLLNTEFKRVDLESMLFRGLMKLKTIAGERYVSSIYWRNEYDQQEVQPYNFKDDYARDNNVLLLEDGSVFGDISKPIVGVIPVPETFNTFIDNIGGAHGVSNILTLFK